LSRWAALFQGLRNECAPRPCMFNKDPERQSRSKGKSGYPGEIPVGYPCKFPGGSHCSGKCLHQQPSNRPFPKSSVSAEWRKDTRLRSALERSEATCWNRRGVGGMCVFPNTHLKSNRMCECPTPLCVCTALRSDSRTYMQSIHAFYILCPTPLYVCTTLSSDRHS